MRTGLGGRTLPLPLPRRWIADLMEEARRVPLVPFERVMHLGPLDAARRAADARVGWCALFVRAFALVAARRPELRRAYQPWPWPHLYEHPVSVASVAVERDWCGEPAVFFASVPAPEDRPLAAIEAELRRAKSAPVEEYGPHRRLLRLARLPGPVRRLAWWYAVRGGGGRVRAKHVGTFGVSVTAGLGASALSLLSPLTATLHYGPLDAKGRMAVRLTFDHRVLDGGPVARALADLEETLLGPVRMEMLDGPAARAA